MVAAVGRLFVKDRVLVSDILDAAELGDVEILGF